MGTSIEAIPENNWRSMMSRLVIILFRCMCIWTLAGQPVQAAKKFTPGASLVMQMKVPAGQSETVNSDAEISNLVVGDPDIADASPLGTRSFYILGRKTGRTNLSLYDANDKLLGVINVEVTFDTSGLRDALRTVLPRENIRVRSVNGRVLLQGTVQSATAAARAVQIAKDFGGDNVTNALTVGASQQVTLEVRFIEEFLSVVIFWEIAGQATERGGC